MAVDIKYNGNNIASLEGGKTAIIKCAGKKMKSDLTVIAPASGGGGGSGVLGVRTLNEQMTFPNGIETFTEPYILEGIEGYIYWENVMPAFNGSMYCTFNSIVYAYDTSGEPPANAKHCGFIPVSGAFVMPPNAGLDINDYLLELGLSFMPLYVEADGVKYLFNNLMPAENPPIIIVTKCNNAEAEAWLLDNTTAVE